MNIRKLHIDRYKNLNDFETIFSNEQSLNLIFGKNGSGKSNYFEAISAIFNDLFKRSELLDRYRGIADEVTEEINLLEFNYQIEFVNKGSVVKIIYNSNNLSGKTDFEVAIECFEIYINNIKEDFKLISKYLPRNVFGYYSGETSRLKKYFRKNITDYSKNLKESKIDNDFVRLVFINEKVLDYIIIALKVFSDNESKEVQFINELISKVSTITFKFYSPKTDDNDYFHGLEGDLLRTLELLSECGKSNTGRKGQVSSIILDTNDSFLKLKKMLDDEFISIRIFFENLMNLKYFGVIKNVEVMILQDNEFNLFNLSEGEKQLVTIIGLLIIQKNSDCIFLLDEPDAFLYPQWQRELTEYINNIDVDGQILLSTHSPLSIGEVSKENILLFENGYAINPPINTFGTTNEALLEVVMGVDERNSRFGNLIEQFDISTTFKDISRCKEIVSDLKKIGLPNDDIFFLEAEAEIIRLEVLLEESN